MVKRMVKEKRNGLMGGIMRVNLLTAKRMEKGCFAEKMEGNSLEHEKMENSMG